MNQPKLNTTNPEAMTYETAGMKITVLGGIRLEGLDRMRVTLKVEQNKQAIRHNLDLYSDTQLIRFTRKVAERLEIGTSIVQSALGELTEALENYRLEQLELKQKEEPQTKQLTEEEQKGAREFLGKPGLMERTGEMIGKSGVIGEEMNRLLMYVIFTSRKREHPLHIVSLGSSGSGKTYLQEKVGELIPEEDKIEITVLSENAFYYFGQTELRNKLIQIEDLDGAENVLYPLRELQTKEKIRKTVAHKNTNGETRTINLTVEGPVSVAGCTTKESIYEDNANRSFLIYLDESEEQDQRIMNYQRRLSAGKINQSAEKQIKQLMQNCQRILQPVKVINPYAEHLEIPSEVFKPRRTNAHYLAFIEAITFYHQYQRKQKPDEQTGEIYIQTTLEDIGEANKLIKEILLRKSDELTGACRNHFETLKAHLTSQEQTLFTNREISQALRVPITTVKRHHLELHNTSHLKLAENKKSKGYKYEVVSYEEYRQLKENIATVLDKQLEDLKNQLMNGESLPASGGQPNSPNQPSSTSGPLKNKKTNKLKQVAQ